VGSYAQWDKKLGARLAQAVMSIQTVKGFEIGLGMGVASRRGSQMHDEIIKEGDRIGRKSNNAGGIEGGMSNGQPIVIRAACKPLSTLRKPLQTVDLKSKEQSEAAYERSDVCVVPAASVVGQNVVAFEVARTFREKFGSDTFEETRRRAAQFREGLDGKK
jgi:chorismate synthase